jgi:hypothetical protein
VRVGRPYTMTKSRLVSANPVLNVANWIAAAPVPWLSYSKAPVALL